MSIDSIYYPAYLAFAALLTWLFPRAILNPILVGVTVVFLLFSDPLSLVVLIVSSSLVGGTIIYAATHNRLKISLIISLVLCFAWYQGALKADGFIGDAVLIGFAFYFLRLIHCLIDSLNDPNKNISWIDFYCWIFFLPTFVIGPINRLPDFQRDLRRRRWDYNDLTQGLQRILFGYFQVVVVAGYIFSEKLTPFIQAVPAKSWSFHYLDTLGYGFHLYFIFAGYSSIAIGFALLMGFRIPENFHHPYLAMDIRDFWSRWHITLSNWCKEYIYSPSVALTRLPVLGALASMLVLGLWHEFSIRYLLWGLWHGAGIYLCQYWQGTSYRLFLSKGRFSLAWKAISWFITFNFVILGFVLTSTNNLSEAVERWRVILCL